MTGRDRKQGAGRKQPFVRGRPRCAGGSAAGRPGFVFVPAEGDVGELEAVDDAEFLFDAGAVGLDGFEIYAEVVGEIALKLVLHRQQCVEEPHDEEIDEEGADGMPRAEPGHGLRIDDHDIDHDAERGFDECDFYAGAAAERGGGEEAGRKVDDGEGGDDQPRPAAVVSGTQQGTGKAGS